MAKKKVEEVKPLVLGDKVVLDNKDDNKHGVEGTVQAISQVAVNDVVVNKHTVSFPDGSVRQYVPAENLKKVDAPVVEAPAKEVKEETPAEEAVETPVDEAKEEETPGEEAVETPAEEVKE